MTRRELIQFMDELVELASEENKSRAILVKEKYLNWKYKTGCNQEEIFKVANSRLGQ